MQIDPQHVNHEWISGTGTAYDRLHEARAAIKAKLEGDQARPEDLLTFVLLIDDCGYEVQPTSEGMPWLAANTKRVKEIVGNTDAFMDAVVHAHSAARVKKDQDKDFDSPLLSLSLWFFQGFIMHTELMLLLSPRWREHYVRELYPRFGAWNHGWIRSAIMAGVKPSVIAQAIVERLRRVEVRMGMANDVHDFIEYGAGDRNSAPIHTTLRHLGIQVEFGGELYNRLQTQPEHGLELIHQEVLRCLASLEAGEGYTHQSEPFGARREYTKAEKWGNCFFDFHPWDMLSNRELSIALAICADKAPDEVMGARVKMERRLPTAAVDAHVAQAILGLTSLGGVPEAELNRLSVGDRKALAKRLDNTGLMHYELRPTFTFLLRLVVDLGEDGEAFFREVVAPILSDENIVTAWVAFKRLELSHPDLEGGLEHRLDQAGYWYGHIESGRVPSGKRRDQIEHFVILREGRRWWKYISDDDIHRRYYPQTGELVVFSIQRARELVPGRVYVAVMTPVMLDIER